MRFAIAAITLSSLAAAASAASFDGAWSGRSSAIITMGEACGPVAIHMTVAARAITGSFDTYDGHPAAAGAVAEDGSFTLVAADNSVVLTARFDGNAFAGTFRLPCGALDAKGARVP